MQIPGFKGRIVLPIDSDFETQNYQYATSTYAHKGGMSPAAILQPTGDDDVRCALAYARSKRIALAVRTGGHQYMGASSTSAPNMILDLKNTYRELEHLGDGHVRVGVSHTLDAFNEFLGSHGLFVPHGVCSNVHLGGHVQTGGYGQLLREFGLFADAVEFLDLILADGSSRRVRRDATNPLDSDLFFAMLGGSPGNIAVLTHIGLRAFRDIDYRARGLKAFYRFTPERLERLLGLVSETITSPSHYDLTISVMSGSQIILPPSQPTLDSILQDKHPEAYGRVRFPAWPMLILVQAQWSDAKTSQEDPMPWFNKIRDTAGPAGMWALLRHFDPVGVIEPEVERPMSELCRAWLYGNVREYNMAYEKRAFISNRIPSAGWTKWIAKQIRHIPAGCNVCAQVFAGGGQYRALADGRTAFSWRDTTVVCIMDIFYPRLGSVEHCRALDWQAENDVGRALFLCEHDRRFLFGSYGSPNLDASNLLYFEKGKYERLLAIKKRVDPARVLSANPFSIGYMQSQTNKRNVNISESSMSRNTMTSWSNSVASASLAAPCLPPCGSCTVSKCTKQIAEYYLNNAGESGAGPIDIVNDNQRLYTPNVLLEQGGITVSTVGTAPNESAYTLPNGKAVYKVEYSVFVLAPATSGLIVGSIYIALDGVTVPGTTQRIYVDSNSTSAGIYGGTFLVPTTTYDQVLTIRFSGLSFVNAFYNDATVVIQLEDI